MEIISRKNEASEGRSKKNRYGFERDRHFIISELTLSWAYFESSRLKKKYIPAY